MSLFDLTEYFFTYTSGFAFILLIILYHSFEFLEHIIVAYKFKIKCSLMKVMIKCRKTINLDHNEVEKVQVLSDTLSVSKIFLIVKINFDYNLNFYSL